MNSIFSRGLIITAGGLLASCVILGCATNVRSGEATRSRFIIEAKAAEQNPFFGDYDREFASIVQQRWSDLLDTQPQNKSGKDLGMVILFFQLRHDGTISQLRIVQQTVNDSLALLCLKAISDPAPYSPMPQDMLRVLAQEFRELRFTFYYR